MNLRPAAEQDLPAIQSIYAHHVLHGLASFEEVPPSAEEMLRRFADVTRQGFPYLVAEDAGEVLGYGYCSLYRTRPAYRYTLEDSIYVKNGLQGRGIGKAILQELIRICTSKNYRQIIAVIGDSANAGSIRLHASLGFLRVGVLRSTGYKFGRWVDSVYMQLAIGGGDMSPPEGGAGDGTKP